MRSVYQRNLTHCSSIILRRAEMARLVDRPDWLGSVNLLEPVKHTLDSASFDRVVLKQTVTSAGARALVLTCVDAL